MLSWKSVVSFKNVSVPFLISVFGIILSTTQVAVITFVAGQYLTNSASSISCYLPTSNKRFKGSNDYVSSHCLMESLFVNISGQQIDARHYGWYPTLVIMGGALYWIPIGLYLLRSKKSMQTLVDTLKEKPQEDEAKDENRLENIGNVQL